MKKLVVHLALLLALALGAAALASDVSLRATLDRAGASFDEGVRLLESDPALAGASLRASIAAYESLVQSGVENGKLYYNIGNAHLLLGDTGRAIVNYRRAETFIPSDLNLQANLASALGRVRADFDTAMRQSLIDRLRNIVALAPSQALIWVSVIAWSAGWLAMLLRIGGVRLSLWIPLSSLLLASTAGAIVGADVWLHRLDRRAVVIAPESIGRKGPDAGAYAPSFASPLPAGVEVQILAERPDWTLVSLPDRRETWLASDAIERLWD